MTPPTPPPPPRRACGSAHAPHNMYPKCLSVLFLLSPLLTGCSQASRMFGDSSSPNLVDTSQSVGTLTEAVSSSGSLWPVSGASALFLLASIPAFFVLSRKQFAGLLAVGILLAILPIVLVRVLEHLVVPTAILLGLTGVTTLVFFVGRMWDRRLVRRRATTEAARLTEYDTPKRISDIRAAKAVLSITDRNPSKEI